MTRCHADIRVPEHSAEGIVNLDYMYVGRKDQEHIRVTLVGTDLHDGNGEPRFVLFDSHKARYEDFFEFGPTLDDHDDDLVGTLPVQYFKSFLDQDLLHFGKNYHLEYVAVAPQLLTGSVR